jgi:hypothetical protein
LVFGLYVGSPHLQDRQVAQQIPKITTRTKTDQNSLQNSIFDPESQINMSAVKNVAFIALGAAGAVVAINQIAKPAKTPGLGSVIGRKMSEYNQTVHPEQDRT